MFNTYDVGFLNGSLFYNTRYLPIGTIWRYISVAHNHTYFILFNTMLEICKGHTHRRKRRKLRKLMHSTLMACIVLALPFAILGEHWYTYTIAGIITPVAFIGTWLMYPNGVVSKPE